VRWNHRVTQRPKKTRTNSVGGLEREMESLDHTQTEERQNCVEYGDDHQVPVVGRTFLHPVVGAVDDGAGDVVIHEEQQRQTEAQAHGAEYRRPPQVPQRRRLEYVAFE